MPIAVLGGASRALTVYNDSYGFTIPNQGTAISPALERWTETDHRIKLVAGRGEGVTLGCRVTAQSTPNYTISIAAGTIRIAGVDATLGACIAIPNPADTTDSRIDLVSAEILSSGAAHVVLTAGTASARPFPPSLPSANVGLAFVWVPPRTNTIQSTYLVDKRCLLVAPSAVLSTDLGGLVIAGFGVEEPNFAIAPLAGRIRNFYLRTSTPQSATGDLFIFLQKNGVDTAITLDVAPASGAGTFRDTTHTVMVAAGDHLSLYILNFDGTSAAMEEVSLEIDP
jgi:hypothetical protein